MSSTVGLIAPVILPMTASEGGYRNLPGQVAVAVQGLEDPGEGVTIKVPSGDTQADEIPYETLLAPARVAAMFLAALVLDLPEPLPWERMTWTLHQAGPHAGPAVEDVLLAWSEDGRRAVLAPGAAGAFPGGEHVLRLTLALDVGAERAVWRRAARSDPEIAELRFRLPRSSG